MQHHLSGLYRHARKLETVPRNIGHQAAVLDDEDVGRRAVDQTDLQSGDDLHVVYRMPGREPEVSTRVPARERLEISKRAGRHKHDDGRPFPVAELQADRRADQAVVVRRLGTHDESALTVRPPSMRAAFVMSGITSMPSARPAASLHSLKAWYLPIVC